MSKIKVALRVRPLSQREIDGGFPVVLAVENNSAFVTDIRVPESPNADSRQRYRQFQFDHGFYARAAEGATQSEIYTEMGPPLEASVLDGYNCCLLAYGQSGTGKTHTMLGSKDDPGLIPRLCHSIWDKLSADDDGNKFRMEVSFMEIYREKVRDLLNPGVGHLKLREHPQLGPHVQNLSRIEVCQEHGLLDLLWEGECRRAIGTTGSNHRSSRSHAIWTIYLTRQKTANSSTTITNRVHLVDLAGSEKAGFATAKSLLAEGADINRSLVALGNVISSLSEKSQYIPYRDSALTWLLKDSLGGNATTAIIITASPASCCHAQTLNSFRFAQRARLVENKPRINLNLTPASLSINGTTGIASVASTSSASALYSIMSAFEIKKDISKLSRIIRSAQNNGGILRGLAPRASWTRLVNALEGWNAIESEQLKLQREQRERAASVDTTTSCTTTTTGSKDGSPPISPSKSDATIQADLRKSTSTTSLPATTTPSTPTRIIPTGNEVFIPYSNSIKCLTWKQEEVHAPPKLPDPPTNSDEEYCSVKLTPPTTPTLSSSKRNQFNLLLPVQYPVPQHLDHASRISERIHRSLSALPLADSARLGIVPDALLEENNSPLIRQRIPTLVNCGHISPLQEESALFAPEKALSVPVMSENELFFSLDEEEDASGVNDFTVQDKQAVSVFYKVDPEEENKKIEEVKRETKHRLVRKSLQRKHSLTLQLPPIPSIFSKMESKKSVTFENISEGEVSEGEMDGMETKMFTSFRARESSPMSEGIMEEEDPQRFSSLNLIPSPSWSKCSTESESEDTSSGSWNFSRGTTIPVLVKVIPEDIEEKDFRNESITDWVNVHSNPTVSTVFVDLKDEIQESEEMLLDMDNECSLASLSDNQNNDSQTAVDASTDSKFRNHFSKELTQMDKIGQQLKKLQHMSAQGQRFSLVQPFLDKIFHLEETDHSVEDPKLDAQIEECSGWNVETELNLVNKEMSALSKLLKIKGPRAQRRDSSGSGSSTHSTLPSSSTTRSQSHSVGSPISPMFGDPHHHNRGKPISASETSARRVSSEFQFAGAQSRNSFSESVVGGLRLQAVGASTAYPLQYQYPPSEVQAGYGIGVPSDGLYNINMRQFNPEGRVSLTSNPYGRISLDHGLSSSKMSSIREHYPYSYQQPHPQHHYPNLYESRATQPRHLDQISPCSSFAIKDPPTDFSSRSHSAVSYGHGDPSWCSNDFCSCDGQTHAESTTSDHHSGHQLLPQQTSISPFSHIFSETNSRFVSHVPTTSQLSYNSSSISDHYPSSRQELSTTSHTNPHNLPGNSIFPRRPF